jgi:hypothetical protein
MFFEDEQSLLSISSSIKAVFEDGAGSLRDSSSGKACFEDEAGLMDGNSYLCESYGDDTP